MQVVVNIETTDKLSVGNDIHIVAISWASYTMKNELIKVNKYVIKPNNFVITPSSTNLHGVTQVEADLFGVDLAIVLNHLIADLSASQIIVGYNLFFNLIALNLECQRLQIKLDLRQCKFVSLLHIATHNYGYMKFSKLYQHIFKTRPAEYDVTDYAKVYFVLKYLNKLTYL